MAKKEKLNAKASKPKKAAPSTKRFLDVAEIKEDTIVMKDGTLRAILLVSSINFALKSEDEQNAIIAAYVGFLNSLDFPMQIVIQSRKLDIDGYMARLQKREKELSNELLRLQIADYRQYVKELVELGEIMTKRFFLVVPYNPMNDKQKKFFRRALELFRTAVYVRLTQDRFAKRRRDLFQRVDYVISSLGSIGLKAAVLDTQSLIELLYNSYNPGISERQKMRDLNEIQIEV